MHDNRRSADHTRRLAWLALLLLLLAGLRHRRQQERARSARSTTLLQVLPGQYDNRTQAKNDASGAHAAVAAGDQPGERAWRSGKAVMFERETAADDPRRMLAQHIWTFELDKKNEHLVQTVYVFKEPQRWMHAADDPYVLQSVLPEDLSPLSGCKLIWSKSDYGFAAITNAAGLQGVGRRRRHADRAERRTAWHRSAAQRAAVRPGRQFRRQRRLGILISLRASLRPVAEAVAAAWSR